MFPELPWHLRNRRDIVMAAVQKDGRLLRHASGALKDEPSMVALVRGLGFDARTGERWVDSWVARSHIHTMSCSQIEFAPKNKSVENPRQPTALELKLNQMIHLQGGQVMIGADPAKPRLYEMIFNNPKSSLSDPFLQSIIEREKP